ncbi:class I SAM-dependent methyltransferase [Sporichthya sp.]|uniref:class I SAM-dependent methyltransferase n=1 Tax=Sporichthya sp. TaxID=65475 RepID=UPI0018427AAC|nr:class I SAM-dependent methyltransferase [Sporichthya sp.]MBA3743435.1 class I SAM-dependent methyltransferase [Sporichthya sp.]
MSTSRYDTAVNPNASNNSHAIALRMIGWNQRVLELGAANGHMTRAMANWNNKVTAVEFDPDAAVHLKDAAESVVIGDLNNPETLGAISGQFDAVLAGDVLEHLLDPDRVLLQAVEKLAPSGKIVISLPNIAHADVRMALMQGKFDYRPVGLLDETHIRFFTHKTVQEFVRRAGLVIVDMQRVRIPAFETELRVNRKDVPTAVVNEVLADPESETYQFVFTAVKDDGSDQLAKLADQYVTLKAEHEALAFAHKAEKQAHRETQRRANRLQKQVTLAQRDLTKLRRSKVVRYTAPARILMRKLRAAAR